MKIQKFVNIRSKWYSIPSATVILIELDTTSWLPDIIKLHSGH
ncbi:MAG: hypothetical protein QOE37_2207, partial [Microbacteriaceae bacterium]|nr:hypothetical protein [Microbacteriaceae bacterium]